MNISNEKYRIIWTREMMWRVQITGENLGFVKCWHIVDDNDQLLAGGYYGGNNTVSGYPVFKLKMHAVAFLAGYTDYMDGKAGLTYTDKNGVDYPDNSAGIAYVDSLGENISDRSKLASCYADGVDQAIEDKNDEKRQNKPKRRTGFKL